jgi:hypothetical protein
MSPFIARLYGENEPYVTSQQPLQGAENYRSSWIRSMKFFLGSWIVRPQKDAPFLVSLTNVLLIQNILLLFIPLSAMAHYLVWDAGLRFLFSFIAIIPLGKASRRETLRMLMFLLSYS